MRIICPILILCIYIKFCICAYNQCLEISNLGISRSESTDKNWRRQFHVSNVTLPIIIDVSDRPSHRILSQIIEILISERLRYKSVKLQPLSSSLSTNEVMRRFHTQSPHINVEVWQPPGFNVEAMVNSGLVLDCGPLGPMARKGIFAFTTSVQNMYREYNVSIDHWRIFQQPYDFWDYMPIFEFLTSNNDWKPTRSVNLTQIRNIPIILIDKIEYESELVGIFNRLYSSSNPNPIIMIPVNDTKSISLESTLDKWHFELNKLSNNKNNNNVTSTIGPLFFYNWYPNTVTVKRRYSRVLFPDWIKTDTDVLLTDFEINQMSKMTSVMLRDNAPLIYNLISDFRITHKQLVLLLQQANAVQKDVDIQDSHIYTIACNWIKSHSNIWTKWTKGWNTKHKLIIPALLALHGKWIPEYILEASTEMTKQLNEKTFKNLEYELYLDVRNVSCTEEIVLREYITYSSRKSRNNSGTIIAYLAGICSDSLESTLKLATFNKHIIVTSTADSPKFSNKNQFKYFFRNIPSMEMQVKLLANTFNEWNWKRLVLLRKDSMFFESKYFKMYNIEVIEDFLVKEDELNFNKIYKFIRRMRDMKKGKIFIVEYFKKATLDIMCAAYKLKMSLENGYVWFLNPWMSQNWNNESTANCTRQQILSITNRYFVLTHKELIPNNQISDSKNSVKTPKSYYAYPFARFTAEAIKKLANGTKYLLKEHPSAISVLDSTSTAQRLMELMNTDKQIGEWLLQARIDKTMCTIFRWNNGQDYVYISMGKNTIRKLWGPKNNFREPSDGSERPKSQTDCLVERLRVLLGWSCSWTIFLCCSCVTALIILTGVGCFLYCCFRLQKNQEEERARKPFEFICEELAHLDLPNNYVVVNRVVGKGNFGTVYGGEARQQGKWVLVAIKAISKSGDYQYKYDFLAEAKLMSGLSHENIVKLIGICLNPSNNLIYLIMEHVTGGDLKKFLIKRRVKAKEDPNNEKINAARLTKYAKDIASGLHYLHKNLYLHRDIACRNCLIEPDFGIKLGDFGLAKKMKCDRKGGSWYYRFAGLGAMPIRWLPPESLQFGNYSVYSDIWSYGVTLYEIVTFGSFPFGGFEHEEVVDKVKRGRFSIATFLPESFHSELVYKIIKKCCSYHPKERYGSMAEIIEIFDRNPEGVKACLTDDPPISMPHHDMNFSNSVVETGIASTNQTRRHSQISSSGIIPSQNFNNNRDRHSHPNTAPSMSLEIVTSQSDTHITQQQQQHSQPVSYCRAVPEPPPLSKPTQIDKDHELFLNSFVGLDSVNKNSSSPFDTTTNNKSRPPLKIVKSPSIEFIPLNDINNQTQQSSDNNHPHTQAHLPSPDHPESDLGYVTYKTDALSGTPTHSNHTINNNNNNNDNNNKIHKQIATSGPPILYAQSQDDTNTMNKSKPTLTNQPCSLDLSIDTRCSDIVDSATTNSKLSPSSPTTPGDISLTNMLTPLVSVETHSSATTIATNIINKDEF